MKTDKEIEARIKELKVLLRDEKKMLDSMPSIAFQRGEVSDDAKNRYEQEIEALQWVLT